MNGGNDMEYTQFNGKTVGQNLDGMITFMTQLYIFKTLLPVFLTLCLYGAPVVSIIWFVFNTSYSGQPQRMEVVNEFRSELLPRYKELGKITFNEHARELEEKLQAQYKLIDDPTNKEEREREAPYEEGYVEDKSDYDIGAFLSAFWDQNGQFIVGVLIALLMAIPYFIVSLHIWRTILRYVHVAYLLCNWAWFYNWNHICCDAHYNNTLFSFYVPLTPDYMLWNIINIVAFIGIFVMYFIFLFGKPMPLSRKERRQQIRERGYSPTLADWLI
jgi:hypothetical protein